MSRAGRLPPEVAYYVPEPDIVMYGCRPLVPYTGVKSGDPLDAYPPFHVPEPKPRKAGTRERPVGPNFPRDRSCPTCRGRIGAKRDDDGRLINLPFDDPSHRTYCDVCGAMSPRNEANAKAQRLGIECRGRDEAAARKVDTELGKMRRTIKEGGIALSECARRRIWNGYRSGISKEVADASTNLAREGRRFLESIGQVPDWTLTLDARGKVVRKKPDATPAEVPADLTTET